MITKTEKKIQQDQITQYPAVIRKTNTLHFETYEFHATAFSVFLNFESRNIRSRKKKRLLVITQLPQWSQKYNRTLSYKEKNVDLTAGSVL